MLIDFRTYRPDRHVNDLGAAMSYAADYAGWAVARDLLAEAETTLSILENTTPERDSGQYPLVRLMAEVALTERRIETLLGTLAQAERVLKSYPAKVKQRAEDNGWCPIPKSIEREIMDAQLDLDAAGITSVA